MASLFNERDAAVKQLIEMAAAACAAEGKYLGVCGQGPSDDLEFARWLVELGLSTEDPIESVMPLASQFLHVQG